MSPDVHCIHCRAPLGPDGLCPECDAEDVRIAEKLRTLKEQIASESGAGGGHGAAGRPPDTEPETGPGLRSGAEAGPGRRSGPEPGAERAPAGPRSRGTPGAARPGEPAADTGAADAPSPPPSATDDRSAEAKPSVGSRREAVAERSQRAPRTRRTRPADVRGGVSESGLRAREIDTGHPQSGGEAVAQLLEHRRRGYGKIIGLAGLPRHGKTTLADRLRERAAQRPGADYRDYDKTTVGEVNIYYLPGRWQHHVLVDVAGEDFRLLGDYDRPLPALMQNFLWPVLQRLDGLLLLMALPIVWSEWNHPLRTVRQEPAERDEIGMRDARARMVHAHVTLLKYAMVARDLRRLRRRFPQLGLDAGTAPTRNQVDDAFEAAAALRAPVGVAFSKADLYAPGRRPGLFTPDLPSRPRQPTPPLHPERTDPWVLGRLHFPELFDFLVDHVRHFTFDFVQALEDLSDEPDVQEARDANAAIDTLLGAESMIEFVTRHPWGVPGISTRTALRLDRWLDRERWGPDAWRRLHERDPEDP